MLLYQMLRPAKQIVATRNLFVDTEETIIGECRDVTINLPQDVISCEENQSIRVTLQSFNMRKAWYRVNEYNDTFYILGADANGNLGTVGKVKIPNGNYESFTDTRFGLIVAIQTALNTTLVNDFGITAPNTAVAWNKVTNKITMTFQSPQTEQILNLKVVTFTINNYQAGGTGIVQQIIGFDVLTAFQDNYELMGGCNEQRNEVASYSDLTDMFSVSTTFANNVYTYTMAGYYNASLFTEEAVYVRSNLNSTSFQTAGFDTGGLFPYVVNSQILAKIPIPNPNFAYQSAYDITAAKVAEEYNYEANCPLIQFTDNGNSIYSVMLLNKKVASVRLFITDSYGRLIPAISEQQIGCSALHFTCSLRVDVFE